MRTVVSEAGLALMGTGIASGENRAREAAMRAITSPLLEDASIGGAKGVLYNITASKDITADEVQEISTIIADAVHPEANTFVGILYDDNASDELRITVIATGINAPPKQIAVQSPARCDTKSDVSAVEPNRQVLEDLKVHTCALDEEEFELPTFLRRPPD